MNPRTNRVYVSNTSQGRIHVFDGATNTELPSVLVGPGPTGMAVDPATNTVYVAQSRRGVPQEIAGLGSFVDNGTTVTVNPMVSLGDPLTQPLDVALDPVRHRLYVGGLGGDTVAPNLTVMDSTTRAVIKRIDLPGPSRAVAVNPDAHQVFVASDRGVLVVDDAQLRLVRKMETGLPFAVATVPGPGRQLYVGDLRSGFLNRLSYSSGIPQ